MKILFTIIFLATSIINLPNSKWYILFAIISLFSLYGFISKVGYEIKNHKLYKGYTKYTVIFSIIEIIATLCFITTMYIPIHKYNENISDNRFNNIISVYLPSSYIDLKLQVNDADYNNQLDRISILYDNEYIKEIINISDSLEDMKKYSIEYGVEKEMLEYIELKESISTTQLNMFNKMNKLVISSIVLSVICISMNYAKIKSLED